MTRHRARRAGRASLGLVAAGLAVCAGVLVVDHATDAPAQTEPAAAQADASTAVPRLHEQVAYGPAAPESPATARPDRRRKAAGAPTRVRIDALGIDVPVVPITLEGSTLVPPADPQTLGWWTGGAVPGAARGSALLTGHTVHSGGGALDDLETLDVDDLVTVRTSSGRIDYVVGAVKVFSKGELSRGASWLFGQRRLGRLVLVTCEDWNGESYDSNVVVIARPV